MTLDTLRCKNSCNNTSGAAVNSSTITNNNTLRLTARTEATIVADLNPHIQQEFTRSLDADLSDTNIHNADIGATTTIKTNNRNNSNIPKCLYVF
jgi:hypothetical protein